MLDEDIIKASKLGILTHGLLNVYENILVNWTNVFEITNFSPCKIITGKHPFLTKGPYAHFFGGPDVISELSDEKPGKHTLLLYLASILFNLAIFGKIRLLCWSIWGGEVGRWLLSMSIRYYSALYFAPAAYNTYAYVLLLGFKKYYAHKISSMHHLRKVVVENFLNVLSVTAIIMLMIMLTVGMANHVR